MKVCLINGVSAKSGGGKSILTNFLNSIYKKELSNRFVVVVPHGMGYEKFNCDRIIVLPFDDSGFSSLKQVYYYYYYIKSIIKKHNVSLIFNLSDVIIPVKHIRQLFLFDWPYAVYPKSPVWTKMGLLEMISRRFKLFLFARYSKYPLVIYAQTKSVQNRILNLYDVNNISILPNAVSLENLNGGDGIDFNLPENKIKFLCLSKYYIHKNIEVFVNIAKRIKRENLPYCVVITIEASQHKNAKKIIEQIATYGLESILINVGEVEMKNVPSLYGQTNALLLPTLLESFSGTYVEAMYHGKPIFTSDMDFAKDVCGHAAIYFNPFDEQELFAAICKISDHEIVEKLVEAGANRLKEFLTWKQVSSKILNEIEKNI